MNNINKTINYLEDKHKIEISKSKYLEIEENLDETDLSYSAIIMGDNVEIYIKEEDIDIVNSLIKE